MGEIVLYGSVHSRTFTARWILEELGIPYRVEDTDISQGKQKRPAYLAINPMGKVPAITDDGVVVTECPAICLHLADRYGMGKLAPPIDDPRRGVYLRWSVFATAVLEPAIYFRDLDLPERDTGWGDYDTALDAVGAALKPGPWLLGEMFSAADVAVGAVIAVAIFNKHVKDRPVLEDYNMRLAARPACIRAAQDTWPQG